MLRQTTARLLRSDFHAFLTAFWPAIESDPFADTWYIRWQCALAQRIVLDIVARKPASHLYHVINVPPGSSKSTIWSRMLPAWCWTVSPSMRLITASYADDIALENAEKSQVILTSDLFRDLFPHIAVEGTKTRLRTTKGGVRYVTATGSKVTGRHADLIIPDDPENTRIAESEAERKSATDFVTKTLSTRKRHAEVTPIVVVQQRLHENDTTGVLLASGLPVNHVCLPAVKSALVQPPELADNYTGDLFDPDRFGRRMLNVKKLELGAYGFAGQYMQDPSPSEGGIWQKWFLEIPDNSFPLPGQLSNYGTDWDTAYSEADHTANAATAYVTAGVADGKMYIDDIGWIMAGFPQMVEFMHARPAPHYVEAKASGRSAVQTLKRMGIPAIEVEVQGGDKVARAELSSVYAQAGMVCIRASIAGKLYHDAEQGILRFPKGKKQDLADALAQSMQRLMKRKTDKVWIF